MKHALHNRLSKGQYIFGICYLVAQQYLIPRLIVTAATLLNLPLSNLLLNFTFFAVNFVVIVSAFHRYLLGELVRFFEKPLSVLGTVLAGFALYWVASYFVSLAIAICMPNFYNPNDANIQSMAAEHYRLMFTGSVLLVPLVEETLYRGVIFGLVDRISRPLAYGVTTLLFALIHVVGYIGTMEPMMLVVSMLQYIPAGLCLSWAYTKSRTIFAPILIHTAVNLIGMAAMR